MRNGYKMIYKPEHHKADSSGCVYEHIIVAEEKLGRPLRDGECVHHVNSNRSDNRYENLMVFKSISDHSAFHHGCEVVLKGDVYVSLVNKKSVCPKCGSYKYYNSKRCEACSNLLKRKVVRPDKETLLDLIKNMTFVDIGKKYGVSDNAIKKWCKAYGLPYRYQEIKRLRLVKA